MIPIKGYATFHPLKHCIVGKVHPPDQVDEALKRIMRETNEDLDNLVDTLQTFGVKCYRPIAEGSDQRPPISPRDYFVALGDTLLAGKVVSGYKDILKQIDRKGISWYLNDDISSANMIRCGDHIHWDISKDVSTETEGKIMSWLHDMGYRVHVTRYGWHMDGVYSILKPGVIAATNVLPELQTIYPNWEIFYPEAQHSTTPIKHEWGGDHAESNYYVNLLSVDEQNCITTGENENFFKFLHGHKIKATVCPLRHQAFWDNGLHCVTQDLYREGSMETYLK